MKRFTSTTNCSRRRGSTLLIVLALLSLLAFTGMVFYTFSAQERAAADYFSEAAKAEVNVPDDPFPWALQQMLTGATDNQKASIFWDPRRRNSMLSGVVGFDAVPHSGAGINIIYDSVTGLPIVDNDYNNVNDGPPNALQDPRNFVGSLAAWGSTAFGVNEEQLYSVRGPRPSIGTPFPEPDVDYTYPDINNLWLAHRGWAIRDNGPTVVPIEARFERVPVFIPSFMRPTLMKSSITNGFGGFNTPTDINWWDHSSATGNPAYAVRSYRPSQHHIAGFDAGGNPVRRYLDAMNPADAAAVATNGAFPLRPGEDVNPTSFGQMGLLTGHAPGTVAAPINFRLDQDNDGDGVFEGIWMDFGYPAQQTAAGQLYATLYSFTIYDLDSLIDLNSHGNITQLVRTERVTDQAGAAATGSTPMAITPLSASHQGLGPHEVSPLWALAPTDQTLSGKSEFSNAITGYGTAPISRLEQANMEWLWLLTGRIDSTNAVWDGRWGDANALWYHVHSDDGAAGNLGQRRVSTLPRPGRAGNLIRASSDAINFGGSLGFDDNQNALEGVASTYTGVLRGFVHPLDIGGTGRVTVLGDPRIPQFTGIVVPNTPDRWRQYNGYSLIGDPATVIYDEKRYLGGRDQNFATPADNTFTGPRFNLGFEDPQELINDADFAVRPDDAIFAPADILPAHLTSSDISSSTSNLSVRLSNLSAEAFQPGSDIAERFTTLTNTLRSIKYRHDLGPNLVSNGGGVDDGPRFWETNADTDGRDTDGDGFADGDGELEFPPAFGVTIAAGKPYSITDPYRAVVRRLLTTEVGETRELILQLPLSLNHILDVNRTADTPAAGTPEFLRYLQKTGMRFRRLTEHPLGTETDSSGQTFTQAMTTVPTIGTPAGNNALLNFPPRTFADREFWARRDRQQLARDIYVLLYTIGGGQVVGGIIENATGDNSGQAIYTHEEMRRMAQFAVNMVDAMDTDDIVTMFEYDKNLGNGWNLDDDPYTENPAVGSGTDPETGDGMYPLDNGARGVVFGVEAQQLSFSEVLAVRLEDFAKYPGAADDPTTSFNDVSGTPPLANPDTDRQDRYVLHLELQNNQPYPVPLSENGVTGNVDAERAIWQIARVDREDAGSTAGQPSDEPQDATLDPFDSPTGVDGTTMSFMDGNADIAGGSRFSISMASKANATDADPLGTGTADLYLQKPTQTDYSLISPDEPGIILTPGSPATGPRCSLDTISTVHDGRYLYDQTNSDKGHFLREIPYAAAGTEYFGNKPYGFDPARASNPGSEGTGQGFEVVLRRRLNPNLPLAPLTLNPWVEVDRIRVEFRDLFEFTDTMGSYTATAQFDWLNSEERVEPLDATGAIVNTTGASGNPATDDYRYNTISYNSDPLMGRNDATTGSGGVFHLWQPHFDRDFASPVDLFHLPVVGPRLLTNRLQRMRYAPAQQASVAVGTVDAAGDPDLIGSAVAMFLQPDFLPVGNTNGADDNAWYRLLQFVEVPSRVNTMLGDYLTRYRLPGKVNLNGIRHIEVYAGLIDDALIADVPVYNDPDAPGSGVDANNQFAPFMSASTQSIPMSDAVTGPAATPRTASEFGAQATGPTAVNGAPLTGYKDRWFEFINERDGATAAYDPVNARNTNFWIPGTPNAKPFRSPGYRKPVASGPTGNDTSLDDTILRRFRQDVSDDASGTSISGTPVIATNRNWLELGSQTNHHNPNSVSADTSQLERHQVISKLFNNTTTVSNACVIYGTAAYFRAVDQAGLIRVGGRMGLDLDADGDETNDAGWEQRAVFIVDRTELLKAYDAGTGSFDWQRLIKYRADLASDSQ